MFYDPAQAVHATEWPVQAVIRDRWTEQRLFTEMKRLIKMLEEAGIPPTTVRLEVRGLIRSGELSVVQQPPHLLAVQA